MTTTVLDAVPSLAGATRSDQGFGHLAAEVTYERIAGAIAAVTVHGAQVRVHWKNPLTGAPMGESTATMSPDGSRRARLRAQARRSVMQQVAAALVRALAVIVGGVAGRVVRDAAHTASHDLPSRALAGATYTDASRRDAVVRAFAAVRPAFTWEERSGRFVAR